jgi:oxygen-dependent protoporphyrinogen oxidase
VIVLRYPEGSLVRTVDGSGFLVDPDEGLATAACSWYSSKWPHLTGGRTVLRAVVTDPRRLEATDDDLTSHVAHEVGRVMGAKAEPDLVQLHRWDQALPVFAPGHQDRIRQALAELPDRIAVAGAFLGAVGVPDCIESGEAAARRLVSALAAR